MRAVVAGLVAVAGLVLAGCGAPAGASSRASAAAGGGAGAGAADGGAGLPGGGAGAADGGAGLPGGGAGLAAAQISRFRWSSLSSSPLGARDQPLLAWAGGDLLEFGGTGGGAVFSPATGRWHRAAGPPRGLGPVTSASISVWTGHQLVVAGGGHAGLYDPAANRWSMTALPAWMAGLELTAAVWTGRDVVVAGTNVTQGRLGVASFGPVSGSAAGPAAGRWQPITPVLPAGHPSRWVVMAYAAGRLILWSSWDRVADDSDTSGVDVLTSGQGGAWRDVTGNWPQNQTVTSPVSTGSGILISPGQIWCGTQCSPPFAWNPGYFADPVTLARKIIPLGPIGHANPAFVWTGHAIIAINEYTSIGGGGTPVQVRPDDMALWDPAARRWSRLPTAPGYPPLSAVPVWTGRELLALTTSGHLLSFHR